MWYTYSSKNLANVVYVAFTKWNLVQLFADVSIPNERVPWLDFQAFHCLLDLPQSAFQYYRTLGHKYLAHNAVFALDDTNNLLVRHFEERLHASSPIHYKA